MCAGTIETREALGKPATDPMSRAWTAFIGPADLSADMGLKPANPAAPGAQAATEQAIGQMGTAGKAPGIPMANEPLAKRYRELGALFVAVGVDTTLLPAAGSAGGTVWRTMGYVGVNGSATRQIASTKRKK